MTGSLFSRISRYPRSPLRDARENRLTEITASVLERIDNAPQTAVVALLQAAIDAAERRAAASEMPPPADLESLRSTHAACVGLASARSIVSTQVATPNGRFVDLAIALYAQQVTAAVPAALVWLEVKYGADLHGDQAYAYLQAIKSFPATHRVVLVLTPRGQELKGDLPAGTPVVDWQTVARAFKKLSGDPEVAPEQRWLLAEYVNYLDEEGLMDPEALTPEHAAALARMGEAAEAIAGVCEHAHGAVLDAWAKPQAWLTPRGASEEPDYGLDFWASYDPKPRSAKWRDGWFDWGVGWPEDWQYYDAMRSDAIAFFAGVGFRTRANPYFDPKNETWVATLLHHGFAWCWFEGAYRLVRCLYPDELLTTNSLESQGRLLGGWVVATFDILRRHPPAH